MSHCGVLPCRFLLLYLFFLISIPAAVSAGQEIEFKGYFRDKATFRVDGRMVYLGHGQTSQEGIKLLFADRAHAIIEVDGHVYQYMKRSSRGKRLKTTIVLERNPFSGVFYTPGHINGREVKFLVDTGATSVAMNSNHARRLRIRYTKGKRVEIRTAGKRTRAYRVTLDCVQVGGIIARHVAAVVNSGRFPEDILLGNSFLNQLDIRQEGNTLMMEKRQ